MRVPYDEGVAIHIGPEPCAGIREGVGEASAGERAGQPAGSCRRPGQALLRLAGSAADEPSAGWRRPGVPFAGLEQAVLWVACHVVAQRQDNRQVLTFTDHEIVVQRGRETAIAALVTCDNQWRLLKAPRP